MKNSGKNRIVLLPGPGMKLLIALIAGISLLLLSNNSTAGVQLKAKVPDLCYKCHKELKKDLNDRHTHFLFKQGKCITCHSSHVSNTKGLIKEDVNSLCLGCHEKLRKRIERESVHSALRVDDCSGCHDGHSSDYKNLLAKRELDLCMKCHGNVRDQFKQPYACKIFRDGRCSACHDSHASSENHMLRDRPVKLCQKCHAPKCRSGNVSIASEVKNVDCTSCHTGHSSTSSSLVGPYGHSDFLKNNCAKCHNEIKEKRKITTRIKGSGLCLDCHKAAETGLQYTEDKVHAKGSGNPCIFCHDYHSSADPNLTKSEATLCADCHEETEKKTALMEMTLGVVKCEPVRDRKCFECHIPGHSDRKLDYREDELTLCARCHKALHKITHPQGEGVIDPRNGGPVTCNSCHSMHASRADFMLTYDRNRTLCIQCHKTK